MVRKAFLRAKTIGGVVSFYLVAWSDSTSGSKNVQEVQHCISLRKKIVLSLLQWT